MQSLILTLHIIVCVLLVILVLLQSGKEGMGVIFGGGSSSVFGSSGAGGILAKLTALMAVIFVITSLSYTYVTSSHSGSESTILNVKIEDPVQPAASPVSPSIPADTNKGLEQANSHEGTNAQEAKPAVAPSPNAEKSAVTGKSEQKNNVNQGKVTKAPGKPSSQGTTAPKK